MLIKGVYKQTEEHKRKIGLANSISLKGRTLSKKHVKNIRKSLYKGTDERYEYKQLHIWVQKTLGLPHVCEHCGKNNLFGSSINWANKSGKYLRDVNDWIRLCVSCHRKYDSRSI